MPGKEKAKMRLDWKSSGWSLAGTLVIYLVLQLFGAAMIANETVGEGRIALLAGVFAGTAVCLALLVFLRKVQSGRLGLCMAVGAAFVAVVALIAMAGGSWESVVGGIWVLLAGAMVGAVLAAVLGGKRKKKGRAVRRR